jgi:SMI1/KNR4 family protein SUKH-1
MNPNIAELTRRMTLGQPASKADIDAASDGLDFEFPDDYVEFLLGADGGSGFVGEAYLDLFPVERLREMNKAYAIEVFAPHLVLIGSDGGGTGYAFDRRNQRQVIEVPLIGMSRTAALPRGQTFEEFLESVAQESGHS